MKKIMIGLGVGVILLIGGGYWFYQNQTTNKTTPTNASSSLGTSQETTKETAKETTGHYVFPYVDGNKNGLVDEQLTVIKKDLGLIRGAFDRHGNAVLDQGSLENPKLGLIDRQGKIVVKPQYSLLGTTNPVFFTLDQSESENGTMVMMKEAVDEENEKNILESGLLAADGTVVAELVPRQIQDFFGRKITGFSDSQGENFGVIDQTGKILLPAEYAELTVLSDHYLAVRNSLDDAKCSIIDTSGTVVKKDFAETITNVGAVGHESRIAYLAENGKYGLLDEQLNVFKEPFSLTEPIYSGDGQYCSYNPAEGKAAVMDHAGKELLVADYSTLYAPNSQNVLVGMQADNGSTDLLDLQGTVIKHFEQTLLPVEGTELFIGGKSQTEDAGDFLVDATGKERLTEKKFYMQTHTALSSNGIFALSTDPYNEKSQQDQQIVVNPQGKVLSEQAVTFTSFEKGKVFIQEADGTGKIIDSDTGKVLLEKQLTN